MYELPMGSVLDVIELNGCKYIKSLKSMHGFILSLTGWEGGFHFVTGIEMPAYYKSVPPGRGI